MGDLGLCSSLLLLEMPNSNNTKNVEGHDRIIQNNPSSSLNKKKLLSPNWAASSSAWKWPNNLMRNCQRPKAKQHNKEIVVTKKVKVSRLLQPQMEDTKERSQAVANPKRHRPTAFQCTFCHCLQEAERKTTEARK